MGITTTAWSGAGGDQYIDKILNYVHAKHLDRTAEVHDYLRQSIDNGVNNLSIGHDQRDAAGKAYDQRTAGDALGALAENRGNLVGAITGNEAAYHAHNQEDSSHLFVPEVHLAYAVDQGDKGNQDGEEDENMPGGHLNGLALLFILIFAAQSVDDAASRIGLYPVGVADDVGATYCNQHDQQCNTKARAGKQGNFCDLLGHTYVKGVEYAGSKSRKRHP